MPVRNRLRKRTLYFRKLPSSPSWCKPNEVWPSRQGVAWSGTGTTWRAAKGAWSSETQIRSSWRTRRCQRSSKAILRTRRPPRTNSQKKLSVSFAYFLKKIQSFGCLIAAGYLGLVQSHRIALAFFQPPFLYGRLLRTTKRRSCCCYYESGNLCDIRNCMHLLLRL